MINSKLFEFDELILWNFIQCLIKSDYKHLKKTKGFIRKSDLKKHWEVIFAEYMNRSGDNSNVFMLGLLKEYAVLTNKIKLIDGSIELLAKGFHPQIAANLKKMGFVVANNDDPIKYIKGLRSVQTKAKSLVMRANKIKGEIDTFKENAGSSEIKESDFNDTLIVMSKNQGYHISAKTITLPEFISITKLYQENGK